MKTSEGFMLLAPLRRLSRPAAPVSGRDLRARRQPQLAIDDDGLTCRQSSGHDGLVALDPSDSHRSCLHRLIGFDNEDELALLAGLYRPARDDQSGAVFGESQGDIDERARPEP